MIRYFQDLYLDFILPKMVKSGCSVGTGCAGGQREALLEPLKPSSAARSAARIADSAKPPPSGSRRA